VLQPYQLQNLQTKIYQNNPHRTTPHPIAYIGIAADSTLKKNK